MGGELSPILSNVYLHEVLDQWFETQIKPRLKGRGHLTRFADDFVMTFEREEDARRMLDVLPKRFGKYGLRLHPEKTRLIRFYPPSSPQSPPGNEGQRQRSVDLLGLTLYWGLSRTGAPVVKRKTMKSRFQRALQHITMWCRQHRHLPVKEQNEALNKQLKGHYAYYGVTGNFRALQRLHQQVERIWYRWLGRRSNRHLTWARMKAILQAFPLARPRIVHSYLRVASP